MFRHKNYLVRLRKRSCFGLKYPVLSPQPQLENVLMSRKNTQCCQLKQEGNRPSAVNTGLLFGSRLTKLSYHRRPLLSLMRKSPYYRPTINLNYITVICIVATLIGKVQIYCFHGLHKHSVPTVFLVTGLTIYE